MRVVEQYNLQHDNPKLRLLSGFAEGRIHQLH